MGFYSSRFDCSSGKAVLKYFKDSKCQGEVDNFELDGTCLDYAYNESFMSVACCSPDESVCESVKNLNKYNIQIITDAPASATQLNLNAWLHFIVAFCVIASIY